MSDDISFLSIWFVLSKVDFLSTLDRTKFNVCIKYTFSTMISLYIGKLFMNCTSRNNLRQDQRYTLCGEF